MDAAEEFKDHDEFFVQQGREDASDALYEVGPETFWEHYGVVTGDRVLAGRDMVFLGCSC